jgi:hypothetical protein
MVCYNKGLEYIAIIAHRLWSIEIVYHSVYETIPKQRKIGSNPKISI